MYDTMKDIFPFVHSVMADTVSGTCKRRAKVDLSLFMNHSTDYNTKSVEEIDNDDNENGIDNNGIDNDDYNGIGIDNDDDKDDLDLSKCK